MHIARYEFFISANFRRCGTKKNNVSDIFNIQFYLIFFPGVMNARYIHCEFFDFLRYPPPSPCTFKKPNHVEAVFSMNTNCIKLFIPRVISYACWRMKSALNCSRGKKNLINWFFTQYRFIFILLKTLLNFCANTKSECIETYYVLMCIDSCEKNQMLIACIWNWMVQGEKRKKMLFG